jgi:alpha-L-arabinofuranosidase
MKTIKHIFCLSCLFVLAMAAKAQVTMTIDATQRGPLIGDHHYGLFFEEINHAGEGGLYAELVRNRNFAEGLEGWTAYGDAELSLIDGQLLNDAQKNALDINAVGATASNMKGVANGGFWGMNIVKDSTYNLSFYAKGNTSYKNNVLVRLLSNDGKTVLGEAKAKGTITPNAWNKMTATIKATGSDKKGQLLLLTGISGHLYVDVVSLFPYTWKNRKNGLRPDLAQLLADTKPSFLRFPGGCYVEGSGSYDDTYQWKKTIGPIEQRPGHFNRNWGYWSSDGLGFDEYLQMCEDLGAAPLFVVNIGLGHGFTFTLEETETLVQDALDAIEYANGDASTTWGAKRIANGHAEPYNLKFIEIGNENYQADANSQSQNYAERYYMFYKAIKEKYPEVVTIGNVEAWGTDNPTWRNEYPVEIVDEHYYRSHSWMRSNYNKYDVYPRGIKIYNGEYAANSSGTYGKYGNMNSALGEAVYMMGMERNSDVCVMASFAPIFTHEENPLWPYDMIHFNSSNNFVTPSYYVQQMMNLNLGKQNLLWTESGNKVVKSSTEVQVGLGTWSTQVVYDDVEVTDFQGNVIVKDDFSDGMGNWTLGQGSWTITDGELSQTASDENCTAYITKPLMTDQYIYKVRAKKTGGNEGFLIMFNRLGTDDYAWWNLGGWSNAQHGVENCVSGGKTTVAVTNGSIELNRWYDIEIKVDGSQVTCSLDGTQVHQFTLPIERAIYQSVQIDEQSGELILKVANPNASAQTLNLNVKGMTLGDAQLIRLSSPNGTDENTMDAPNNVKPTEETVAADQLKSITIPAYSLNIYRIKASNIASDQTETCKAYEEEDADKYGYLFAHMHTTEEKTCFALSKNGNYWRDLFNSGEVFDAKEYTTTGGMRDAFVCRSQKGNFLLAGTDMTSRLGWTSNHCMTFMRSNDLVHWDKMVSIDLETADNLKALGLTSADDMTAAWAPQIIFDPVTQKYVAYYSVGFPDRHRIYYSLFDEDLTGWTEPRLFFDPGFDVIDADIVWNDVDQRYQMVFKREGDRALSMATASFLVPTGDKTTGSCQWTMVDGFGIDEPGQSIEAPSQFRYIGRKTWRLAYQKYSGDLYYRMMDLDEHGMNPSNRTDMVGSVSPQHGSFVKLTEREYRHLETWEEVVAKLATAKQMYEITSDKQYKEATDKAETALNANGESFEANEKAMAEAKSALENALANGTDYRTFLLDQVKEGKATDLTPLITNADFSNAGTGWTQSSTFTNANGNVAEYWNTNFDFHQTINSLPKGDYEVGVQSFFRMASINTALEAHNSGTEQLNAIFYANENETPVMSLYDASITKYTQSPYNYPDNVTEANAAYNSYGLYTNTLRFTLSSDSDLTIGIRKTVWNYSDWCCFDNFTLHYLGTPASLNTLNKTTNEDGRWYNMQGQPVDVNDIGRGIYLHDGEKVVR